MTAGPWRPVSLEISTAYIEHCKVDYQVSDDLKTSTGTISAWAKGHHDEAVASISLGGEAVIQVTCSNGQGGLVTAPFTIGKCIQERQRLVLTRTEKTKLWFPAGYGEQTLYSVEVQLLSKGQVVATHSSKIGFRQSELVQNVDQHGESFYFRINNIDIFCGGSCWIPADNFLPRITPDKYRAWLQLMVDGNQIMTRYVHFLV
jgi:beta-mannosidase